MASLYAPNALLRTPEPDEDVDPMATVANIADAMLVFACGLMVALVVAWNVDLRTVQEVEVDGSEQVEDLQSLSDLLGAEGSSYIERGTVYQDPRTGQMYLLEGEGDAVPTGDGGRDAGEATGNGAGNGAGADAGGAGASGDGAGRGASGENPSGEGA